MMINTNYYVNTDFFSPDDIRKKQNKQKIAHRLILMYEFTLAFYISLVLIQRLV